MTVFALVSVALLGLFVFASITDFHRRISKLEERAGGGVARGELQDLIVRLERRVESVERKVRDIERIHP
jgi:hypothetical protein